MPHGPVKHLSAAYRPGDAGPHEAVPQTAAGLQGEQPLVKQDNVGKGSRQTSSVTSGEGVALTAGRGLLFPEHGSPSLSHGIEEAPRKPSVRTPSDGRERRRGVSASSLLVRPSRPGGRGQARVARDARRWPALNCPFRTGTDPGNPTVESKHSIMIATQGDDIM